MPRFAGGHKPYNNNFGGPGQFFLGRLRKIGIIKSNHYSVLTEVWRRFVIHIRQGKGVNDRDVRLSATCWKGCARIGGGSGHLCG